MLVYKVVHYEDDKFYSAITRGTSWELEYEIDKHTEAKNNSYIYAFRELVDAVYFMLKEKALYSAAILECETEEISNLKPHAAIISEEYIEIFWNTFSGDFVGMGYMEGRAPRGTAWVKSLIPRSITVTYGPDTFDEWKDRLKDRSFV